jgi:transposase
MKFEELDDVKWNKIAPFLPPHAKEGRPRAHDRSIINGILYVLITGCRWVDLPKRYGDDSTANRRLKNWENLGAWKKVMDALMSQGYERGIVKMKEVSIDSSTVSARKGGKR